MSRFWLALYYSIAFRLPGPPVPGGQLSHGIRRSIARRLFNSMGDNVIVGTRVNFGSGREIEIGSGSNIGRNSWIARDTVFGRNVMTGPEIVILSYNHRTNLGGVPFNMQGFSERRPVVIGDNVWIGTRAILLPGIHIGDNAVIGAGAVVSKSIPAGAIAAGNPAQIVRGPAERKDMGALENA